MKIHMNVKIKSSMTSEEIEGHLLNKNELFYTFIVSNFTRRLTF